MYYCSNVKPAPSIKRRLSRLCIAITNHCDFKHFLKCLYFYSAFYISSVPFIATPPFIYPVNSATRSLGNIGFVIHRYLVYLAPSLLASSYCQVIAT